jgi:tRNA (Guanine-1)-methyltransferase
MVMKKEPIFAAVESIRGENASVILLSPGGRRFTQAVARELAQREHLIFVWGHYEGTDHRVAEHLCGPPLRAKARATAGKKHRCRSRGDNLVKRSGVYFKYPACFTARCAAAWLTFRAWSTLIEPVNAPAMF